MNWTNIASVMLQILLVVECKMYEKEKRDGGLALINDPFHSLGPLPHAYKKYFE